MSRWIPALDGVEAKLERGAKVADVGCGHGASTILMAQAFPASRFVGFDYHDGVDRHARARRRGGRRRRSRHASRSRRAKDFPGTATTSSAFFDCLHDMGDPVGAARHVRETLAPDGTWMIVEPFAGDTLEDNHNPVGRVFYAARRWSAPASLLAGGPRLALGAQAGEARLAIVIERAASRSFAARPRRPFNIVLEARRRGASLRWEEPDVDPPHREICVPNEWAVTGSTADPLGVNEVLYQLS